MQKYLYEKYKHLENTRIPTSLVYEETLLPENLTIKTKIRQILNIKHVRREISFDDFMKVTLTLLSST